MRTIFAEYNPKRNSIDVYTSIGYMLRIDCWEAEKKFENHTLFRLSIKMLLLLMSHLNMQGCILMGRCRCG